MQFQNPIFLLDIDDLHIEAVLDSGFWNDFQLVSDTHAHTYYELTLCHDGDFSIILADGTSLAMDKGSACLIPPGVYHHTANASFSAKKLAIRFYCTRTLAAGNLYSAFIGVMAGKTTLVRLEKQQDFLQLSDQLRQELLDANFAWDSCVKALLTQLFIRLLRLVCKEPGSRPAETPSADVSARRLVIEDFFNSRYTDSITEEDLARHMHLSKRQLSRVLQQLYGSSFRKLLIDIRLSHATQLLRTTALSTEEIACRVGYSSTSGFYEAFRKRYGISAGSYQQHLFR